MTQKVSIYRWLKYERTHFFLHTDIYYITKWVVEVLITWAAGFVFFYFLGDFMKTARCYFYKKHWDAWFFTLHGGPSAQNTYKRNLQY